MQVEVDLGKFRITSEMILDILAEGFEHITYGRIAIIKNSTEERIVWFPVKQTHSKQDHAKL